MSRVQAAPRPSHRRSHAGQRAWIVFGGRADHAWQRLLQRGFRHCFAAIEDEAGWLVLDPLSSRLLLARIAVLQGYDLPGFYRRAGLLPLGPFALDDAVRGASLGWMPLTCVTLCRAVLGPQAPFALTPAGLHRALNVLIKSRKKKLDLLGKSQLKHLHQGANCVLAFPTRRNQGRLLLPERGPRGRPFLLARPQPNPRRSPRMAGLFRAPKPVVVPPPAAPTAAPAAPDPAQAGAQIAEAARIANRTATRQGTIATSARGVLAPLPIALTRKSLLGE